MALLPSCAESTDQLDRQLAAALTVAMAARPSTPSATAMKDQPTLRSAQLRASRGEPLPWSQWATLTKPGCAPTKDGQQYQAALADVMAAAGRPPSHHIGRAP